MWLAIGMRDGLSASLMHVQLVADGNTFTRAFKGRATGIRDRIAALRELTVAGVCLGLIACRPIEESAYERG